MRTPRVSVIVGKAGSGKSRLLTALCRDSERLLVIDTMREHAPELAEEVLPEDVYAARASSAFRFSVYPDDEEIMEWLCMFAASQRDLTLVFEEYSVWYPHHSHQPCVGLNTFIRCGRKLSQRLIITTQTPTKIPQWIDSQGGIWILFIEGANDADYIKRRCGVDPRELAPIETDEAGRHIRVPVLLYEQGRVSRFELYTPTAELRSSTPAEDRATE